MKKTLLIKVLLVIILGFAFFVAAKFYNFANLKSECIRNINETREYKFFLVFDQKVSHLDIDKFKDEIKTLNGVKDVVIKTKDEIIQDFIKKQGIDPETLKAFNEYINSDKNNIQPELVVSSINNINFFIELEQSVLDKADSSGLKVVMHDDGGLKFSYEYLMKADGVSLINDFPKYIFSKEKSYYFGKYDVMCNSKFIRE